MKTDLTLKLEREIWLTTVKQGVFGCYEVTIGQYGRERVDFMTMDTKGIFRCYEIKISKSDFHSSAAQTFCGHYNYFVMPQVLYEQVKTEIPRDIGVFCEARFRDGTAYKQAPCVCVKRAQRRELTVSVDVLKDSLIRSLSRDVGKQVHSGSPTLVELYNRELAEERHLSEYYRKQCDILRGQYEHLYKVVAETYGEQWETGLGKDFTDSI